MKQCFRSDWARFWRVLLVVFLLALAGCEKGAQRSSEDAGRYTHAPYQSLSREELLLESQRKAVVGRKRSLGDVRRVTESVAPLVEAALHQSAVERGLKALSANGTPVEALRDELRAVQEANLLLESGGDPEAVSSAGAVGVAQWLAETARRAGLRVDLEEDARILARMSQVRAAILALQQRPREWSKPERAGGQALSRDEWIARYRAEWMALRGRRRVADERRDPGKAIAAQARYLVRLWQRFGGLDWALLAYHGGERGVERTLRYFRAETGRSPASFADLYFTVSPRRTPKTFGYLYGRWDDHRYYVWRVHAARLALARYRRDPVQFEKEWVALAPGFPLDRAWYPGELDRPFEDVAALQAAYREGLLQSLPDDVWRYGYAPRLRLTGAAPDVRWYRGARAETLAMLHDIACVYRESGGTEPLRVVGAVTTAQDMALAQRGGNGAARKEPANCPAPALASHACGLAVDIARPEGAWDRKVLEYALGVLGDGMRLSWVRYRATNAYHLCPNPAFVGRVPAASAQAFKGQFSSP